MTSTYAHVVEFEGPYFIAHLSYRVLTRDFKALRFAKFGLRSSGNDRSNTDSRCGNRNGTRKRCNRRAHPKSSAMPSHSASPNTRHMIFLADDDHGCTTVIVVGVEVPTPRMSGRYMSSTSAGGTV